MRFQARLSCFLSHPTYAVVMYERYMNYDMMMSITHASLNSHQLISFVVVHNTDTVDMHMF